MFYFTEPNDFTEPEKNQLIELHVDNVIDILYRERVDKSVGESEFKSAKRQEYIEDCANFPTYVNVTAQMINLVRGQP